MTSIALRPRGGPEIVDAAIQLLRRDYLQYVTLALVAFLPVLALQLVLPALTRIALLSIILTTASEAVGTAAVISAAAASYLGRPASVRVALQHAWRRAGGAIAVAFMSRFMLIIGLALFVVPGLILFALLFAAMPVVVLEGGDASEAMTRSARLSAGRRWPILLTLGLTWLLVMALVLTVTFAGSAFADDERLSLLLVSVMKALLFPLGAIVSMLLYFDARIRKEGIDLEV